MDAEVKIGDSWELELGGRVLGRLRLMEALEPWHYGEFEAEAPFGPHADLFQIRDRDGRTKGWDDRQADVHRIRELAFSLHRRADGYRSSSFSLFVDGRQGRLRVFPELRLDRA
ncbi:MAG: hypothetical protein H6807_09650 [Planctomycetes bacterium]|nr:hypothetical protein [Planctomycetota bacterium]